MTTKQQPMPSPIEVVGILDNIRKQIAETRKAIAKAEAMFVVLDERVRLLADSIMQRK